MNKQDRKDIIELKSEMKNVSRTVEKMATNDLPHLHKGLNYIKGRMSVLVPLVMALVVGFIALAVYLAEVF